MHTVAGFLLLIPFAVLLQGSPSSSKAGEIVLLAAGSPPQSVPRLREALNADDPRVRMAAARVVGATRARELWSPLSQALLTEQDPGAAAEQVRAMLLLQGAARCGWRA